MGFGVGAQQGCSDPTDRAVGEALQDGATPWVAGGSADWFGGPEDAAFRTAHGKRMIEEVGSLNAFAFEARGSTKVGPLSDSTFYAPPVDWRAAITASRRQTSVGQRQGSPR